MRKKALIVGIASLAVLIIVIISAVYIYLAPSNKKKEMSQQYTQMAENERMIVVRNTILDERAVDLNGKIYMPVQVASDYFNKRLFWDGKENILSYTMPTVIVKAELNRKMYMKGISEEQTDYIILTKIDKTVYIALDFVKLFTNIKMATYENPKRIVTDGEALGTYPVLTLGKSTRLRTGPNKKYEYLLDLEKGQELFSDQVVENEYQKVMTMDGIVGYIPRDTIESTVEKNFGGAADQPVFEQTKATMPICLAWHQVTNTMQNAYLSNSVDSAKGLNIISPTWFSLSDNKGNFTSLANESYVQAAHNRGLKVWALVDDFNTKINLQRLLGRTSTRQQLVNKLVASAIQYNIDGINIDFEKITAKSATAYLEFLRELAVKCHSNQLVLSVDNYMPANYNSHYDLEEQGKVADYVIFMGYDEHYAGSEEAGSVSSIGFIKNGLENIVKLVPKERVVMALPFYTRLWKETKVSGRVKITSEACGMDTAKNILQQNGAMATWDETTAQYYSEYKKGKVTYKIWLEEEKSMEQKLLAAKKRGVSGVAFWKLGFERASIWDVIEDYLK